MKIKDIRRKNLKKKIFLTAIMFVVLGIGIGYAYLRDTLTLEDNAKMSMTWNVHFDNVQKLGNSIDPATTPTLNKTSFSTSISFTDVSQVYETRFDVKNDGSLDAMIDSYSTNPIPTNLQSYFDTTVVYYDGDNISNGDLLSHGTTDGFRIRISIKNGVNISELPNSIPISFSVNYVKADGNAVARVRPTIKFLSGIKGNLRAGDQIQIGDTEQFYVISSDSNATVLLAKYNLLVGNIVENGSVTGQIQTSETGYGLQSADATGYIPGSSSWKGTVAFSSTNYWDDGNGTLLSPYNANGARYAENFYPNVYDTNSNIYQYISGNGGYVDKLKEMGAPSTITGRLITFQESLATSDIKDNGSSIILSHGSYWTGSASDRVGLWCNEVDVNKGRYANNDLYGVRPVIEIPTSDLN